jgi:hypothetical protein
MKNMILTTSIIILILLGSIFIFFKQDLSPQLNSNLNFTGCEVNSDCVYVQDPFSGCCDLPTATNKQYYKEYHEINRKVLDQKESECDKGYEQELSCAKRIYDIVCQNKNCKVIEE